MKQTIDMKCMRYLNLFEKITGVRTKNCFSYNNFVIFAVPGALMSRVIGENGKNAKQVSYILGKKVKIVSLPENARETEKFVADIVSPFTFRNLEVTDKEIIIYANKDSKAALIGRNKIKLEELKKIIEEYFGKELRLV